MYKRNPRRIVKYCNIGSRVLMLYESRSSKKGWKHLRVQVEFEETQREVEKRPLAFNKPFIQSEKVDMSVH